MDSEPEEPNHVPAHIADTLRLALLRRWANRLRGRYGVPVYLCGSALRDDNDDPRDWDVRLMLPDEDFAVRFGPVADWIDEGNTGQWTRTRWRWSEQCVKDTRDFARHVHLNGDVQIYPESYAMRNYGDEPRLRLDTYEPAAAPHAAPREGEPTTKFDLDAVIDPEFCGGLDPVTYLDRLHEQVELPDFARTLGLPNDASAEAILDALVALKSQSASQQAALDAAGEDTKRIDWLERHPTACFNPVDLEADSNIAVSTWSGINDRQYSEHGEGRTIRAALDAARASHPEARDGE